MQNTAFTPPERIKRVSLPRQPKTKLSSTPPAEQACPCSTQAFGGAFCSKPQAERHRPPTAEEAGMYCSLPCRILAYNSNWRRVILIS